jgi:Reverse transcriptase (RNA-dependent DNA polymerase)
MCIDYRMLNKLSVKNVYLLSLISEMMLDKFKHAKYFTKINLDGTYHQIRIKLEDISKTGFNCQLGHYKLIVMTFGLTNVPVTFQHLMNHAFKPHNNTFIVVYLDDLLIFSKTQQKHLQHVCFALNKLREHWLYRKKEKWDWMKTKVEYLGHTVSQEKVIDQQKN